MSTEGAAALQRYISTAAEGFVAANPDDEIAAFARAEDNLRRFLLDAAYRQWPGAPRVTEGKAFGHERQLDPVGPEELHSVLDALCPGLWPFC